MRLLKELDQRSTDEIGKELHSFAAELYPICRSITGDGLRQTLALIQKRIPLETTQVLTGTAVLDWTVPKEWNIRDAYIKDAKANRVVDFQQSNLHVLNYSTPVHATMPLAELKPHLFTIPEHPDWIPYRTSYYQQNWGFCLSHNQMLALEDGDYDVCIDSSLVNGHLTYGEYYLPGESADEVLISCHACHPSLANDNLSGLSVATALGGIIVRPRASLFVPVPVYPGNDRSDHLAGAKPRKCWSRSPRAGVDRNRRRRRIPLQKEPPGQCGDRPGGRASATP